MATKIEIKETSRQLTDREIYRLMLDMGRGSMRDLIGSVISIDAWALYTDYDKDGQELEVLSILTPEKEAYTTTSKTFIREFQKMLDCISDLDMIEISEGVSRNGRSFIYCRIPDDK